MAYVYAQLIKKGYREFKKISVELKEEVRAVLLEMDREDLIVE